MVICLERGADLHIAQRMPLPLTVSCFSKIQIGFTFLVLAHPGSPGRRAVKQVCACVCVTYLLTYLLRQQKERVRKLSFECWRLYDSTKTVKKLQRRRAKMSWKVSVFGLCNWSPRPPKLEGTRPTGPIWRLCPSLCGLTGSPGLAQERTLLSEDVLAHCQV